MSEKKNKNVLKVYANAKTGQKLVTIPKDDTDVEDGDFITYKKVELKGE